jgi:hypothetical protein
MEGMMSEKPLPDDFHDDLQWEIESDKEWDAFYLEQGIDRPSFVRAYCDAFMPWYIRLWEWLEEKFQQYKR